MGRMGRMEGKKVGREGGRKDRLSLNKGTILQLLSNHILVLA